MTMIRDHVSIRVLEPDATNPTVRPVQDRTFMEWRNKKFVLWDMCPPPLLDRHFPPSCSSSSSSITPNTHSQPVVMEFFKDLQVYDKHAPEAIDIVTAHKQSHHTGSKNYRSPTTNTAKKSSTSLACSDIVYSMRSRRTYNIKTFALMCGVVWDPREPFQSVDDLLPMLKLQVGEKDIVDSWVGARQHLSSSLSPRLIGNCSSNSISMGHKVRLDGVAANSANRASAILGSTTAVTEQHLYQFYHQAMFLHHFFLNTKEPKVKQSLRAIFGGGQGGDADSMLTPPNSPIPANTVHLYYGVTRYASSWQDAQELDKQDFNDDFASLSGKHHEQPYSDQQVLLPVQITRLAQQLGIKLFQRRNLRYVRV